MFVTGHYQTKMLAKTKIQNGGFVQRWPPDQNRFSGFHESIVKMQQKM